MHDALAAPLLAWSLRRGGGADVSVLPSHAWRGVGRVVLAFGQSVQLQPQQQIRMSARMMSQTQLSAKRLQRQFVIVDSSLKS